MEDLYFIRLIARAFQDSNPRNSLLKAFEQIELLGGKAGYEQGHIQFRRFMAEARKSLDLPGRQKVEPEHDLIPLEMHILRKNKAIDSFLIAQIPSVRVIKDARPGLYTIKLNTGRFLWEGRLTEQELLWKYAFPEESFLLAADTGDQTTQRTREIILMKGDLILRVYPGLEAGFLQIEIKDTNNGE